MKFGVCIGLGYVPPAEREAGKGEGASFEQKVDWMLQQIDFLSRTGYDYVEFPVGLVAGATDAEYAAILEAVGRAAIKPEAFNCFIPGEIRLTGPDVDRSAIEAYLETALNRSSECGAKVIVFGSGAARAVPDGFPWEKAEEQIVDFLKLAGSMAFRREMVVAVEPLNRKETNIINSVTEGVSFAERADMLSVGVLADFYHMDEEKEDFESIVDAGSFLSHVHVADTGRRHPGSGSYDYEEFFSALKAIYYTGRVSIEASIVDFEKDIVSSLKFLKQAWEEAPEPEED